MKSFSFIKKLAKLKYSKSMGALKTKITPKKYANFSLDLKINEHDPALLDEKVETILEKYSSNPEKLTEYIKGGKTDIFVIKNANRLLAKINEEEGFITPLSGYKALYINLMLYKKFSTKTNEMFIVGENFSQYLFCYEFYKWYCYKTGVKGYEADTQRKYKRLVEKNELTETTNLSFDDIVELKLAIQRDIEAINFVRNFAVKHTQSAKVFKDIKKGKLANI